ncbi:MAG TPA: 50S ribosomal protein L32e [Nanoarchaeota archaeon]|nr:50S ribosomal protein L32e [Nanoarchaeota archaeon]
MTEIKKLLEIKKALKKKRPHFIRQDTWKFTRLANNPKWRQPRGKHSKMRERRVGKHKRVEIGYRNPAEVRGLSLAGFALKLVHNLAELQKLNPKTDIAILSSAIGLKAKIELAKKVQEMGIKSNVKLETLNARLAELKKQKALRATEKVKEPKEDKKAEKKATSQKTTQPAPATAVPAVKAVPEQKTENRTVKNEERKTSVKGTK